MTRPLHILVIHEVNYLKKVVIEFQEIPEILALRGHQVTFMDFGEGDREAPILQRRSRTWKNVARVARPYAPGQPGITLLRPPTLNLPGLDRLTAIATHRWTLEKYLEQHPVDLIWLYSAPTNGVTAVRLAKKKNIPVIFRCIDVLHHMRSAWTRPFVRWAEREVCRSADQVSALTPALGEYAVQMGADPKRVSVLGPAVDTKLFSPGPSDPAWRAQFGIPAQAQIALFMGTFFPFSGVDFLVERFSQVVEKLPAAHLVLLGGGELEPKVSQLIRDRGLAAKVTLIPFRPYEQMPKFLREASLTLCPFHFSQATLHNFPCKLVQYLACGTPTLCTPMPGTQGILPGPEAGIVYAKLADFPARIIELLGDARALATLSTAARGWIQNHCDLERQVDQIETAFQAAVRSGADTICDTDLKTVV